MPGSFLLMRHAKSSWAEKSQRDCDRRLNERGERVAPMMGQFLREQGFEPDFVWCSPAARTRQTLEMMLPAWPKPPAVEFSDPLYLAPASTILSVLRKTPAGHSKVLMVGHNPGMQSLVARLSGEYVDFPTAAAALFELPEGIPFSDFELSAVRMLSLWQPKLVGIDA